MKDEYTYIM